MILVTGGARGLGAEICRTLAAKGHALIIHYRNSEAQARALADELPVEVRLVQGELGTKAGREAFVKAVGPVDILINNIGSYHVETALETPFDVWEELFQTNFFAPLELTTMLSGSVSQVINIGVSGLFRRGVLRHATAYGIAKHALWALTCAHARELAPKGVRVNMVSPGELENSIDLLPGGGVRVEDLPQKRPVTMVEVARTIAWLLEEENGSITGQNIEVAGGLGL